MYNIPEKEIKKAFDEAVKAGEVIFTGGYHQEKYYWSKIDNRLHSGAPLHQEVEVNAKEDPYKVTGGIENKTDYLYKGFISAVYHADGDGYHYLFANGMDVGYDYYGIFQIAYVVGDIAFTDPTKAKELYIAEMHRREKEAEEARANAKKTFEAKVEKLAKKHRILSKHIVGNEYRATFYLKDEDKIAVNIENGKEYPILLNERGYICFYAKSERYEREYNLHVYDAKTGNEADFYAEQSARIFLRKNFYDWEIEQGKEEVNLIDGVYVNSQYYPEEATDTYLKYQDVIKNSGCNFILNRGKTPEYKNYKGFAKIIQIDTWRENHGRINDFVIFNPVIKNGTLYLSVPSNIAGLTIGKKGANIKALMERWNYFYKDEMITNIKVNAVEKASNEAILNQMREVCHL